jgi:DNA-binding response OmpR family regulator
MKGKIVMIIKKILVVDDEPKIADTVKAYLEADGYEVIVTYTGAQALEQNEKYVPDLIILDLMLPDIAGEKVCEIVRKDSMVPIIMLSAKSWDDSIINGLRIGADDYITKPFSPRQLVAKVHAIFRRLSADQQAIEPVVYENLEINQTAHTVKKYDEPVELTPNEYKILLAIWGWSKS